MASCGRHGFWIGLTLGVSNLTTSGDILGTLRYMSPEQATGRSRSLDRRTDVYSLGATLYELLTLHPAFSGSDRRQLLESINGRDPPLPRRLDRSIPKDLQTIVRKAMAKAPNSRYATANN